MSINRIRGRLAALEKRFGDDGQCPRCYYPDNGVNVYLRQEDDGSLTQETETPGPCPACGRTPAVQEIVEVIVNTRDEAAKWQ